MSGDRGQSSRTEIKSITTFTPPCLGSTQKTRRTISFRNHESSSFIHHSGALSAQHAGYQPLCISLAACVLTVGEGYLSFFSRGHLMLCAADNVSMKQSWSQAGCVTSAGSSTFHIGCSTPTQKIGAAKSSINTACNGSSRFSSQLF